MNIRNLLKATLVSIVLTSSQSYAQESKQQTITVENKKYQITPNKTILNNQGKRVTNQNELKPIILTYLINKELTNYLPIAQNNLKNFNISKTKAQLSEVKQKYQNILKKPINDLTNNSNSTPLFKKIIASLSLYKGAKDEFISIYAVDPKMCIYSDITSHSRKAQKDYENFISLSKQGLTDYNRATRALDLLVESEYIILAATKSFLEVKNSNLKQNPNELEQFKQLLQDNKMKELQNLRNKILSRARKSKPAKNYIKNLQVKYKTKPFQFQQKLKKASIMFYSNQ